MVFWRPLLRAQLLGSDLFSDSEDVIKQKSEEAFSDLDDVDKVLLIRKRRKPERLEDRNILGYRDWSSSEVSSFVNFFAKRKSVNLTRKWPESFTGNLWKNSVLLLLFIHNLLVQWFYVDKRIALRFENRAWLLAAGVGHREHSR